MADDKRDVIVIGAGPAGYVCAIRLAQLGRKVTLVERDRPGGVCLNWGCIPVKALLHAAQTVRDAVEGRRMGLKFPAPEVDLVALYGWKARIVDRLVRGVEYLLKANGVEYVKGTARFNAPDQLAVSTEREELSLTATDFVVATGSRPAELPGVEVNGRDVIDSDGALRLVELPARMAVIGAGVIGLEYATILARLGCKVTVLELTGQVLPGVEPDLAALVERAMRREGIEFHLNVNVQGVDRDDGLKVRYLMNESEQAFETDKVLVAIGRRPLSDEVGLDWTEAKTDERGFVRIDASYRAGTKHVFAIGDVTPGPMLAHRASAQGIALAEELAGGKPWRFRAVPNCVYTDPELATVGLSEHEATEQGRKVKVARVPLNAVGRSLTLGRSEGICKLVVDAKTDKVLGASIVGPQADAIITEAAVAVELGLTADKLGRVVHPHPTMSELLFEAAEAIHGRAIHVVNR